MEGSATNADRKGWTCQREISRSYLGRWRNDKIEKRAILEGRWVLWPDQKFVSSIPSLRVPSCIPYFPLPGLNVRFIACIHGKCKRELCYRCDLSDGWKRYLWGHRGALPPSTWCPTVFTWSAGHRLWKTSLRASIALTCGMGTIAFGGNTRTCRSRDTDILLAR